MKNMYLPQCLAMIVVIAQYAITTPVFAEVTAERFNYKLPDGWEQGGSSSRDYDMGTDVGGGPHGKNAAMIKSIKMHIDGFGTLMQVSAPDKYLGKRVRMTASIKSKDVEKWAGMLFRVDSGANRSIAFDNMHNRPIMGTTEWKKVSIVLDISPRATSIGYGAILVGTGQLWFADIAFEIVDDSVPTTDRYARVDEPTNLDFSK